MQRTPFDIDLEHAVNQLDEKINDMVENVFETEKIDQIDRKIQNTIEAAAATIVSTTTNMTEAFLQKQESMRMKANDRKLYKRVKKSRTLEMMMFGVAGIFLVTMLPQFASGEEIDLFAEIVTGLTLIVLPIWFGLRFNKTRVRASRFNRLTHYFKSTNKTKESISRLAEYVSLSEKVVINDIEKMIKDRWFKEGHYVAEDRMLIVSHESFANYTKYRNIARQKQEEQRAEESARNAINNSLPKEVRDMLEQGEEYLTQLRASAENIENPEMTEKLTKIKTVVAKIFEYVEQHPEAASGLHKMMNHYLPMTAKIVHNYDRMQVPVATPQIVKAKAEIEEMLDTLNVAFEKLLGRLFKDIVWDAETDVSVLHSMLAGEGLVKKEFEL